MSKRYNIRWRDSDLKELQRTIKNYNAKISRLSKKDPSIVDFLPDRMTMKKAKALIGTRADFNNITNSLQRFSQKGAEKPVSSKYGVKATQWEVDEFKIKVRRENLRRKKEKERLGEFEIKQGTKPTGNKRKEMGKVWEQHLNPIKRDFNNITKKDWESFKYNIDNYTNSVKAEKALNRMKENYIKGLIHEGYSDDLQKLVKSIPNEMFRDIVLTDTEATFSFVYSKTELEAREEELKKIWGKAHDEING